MPEMTFDVRWPDGSVESCYSPSLVMHDHLTVGATYTVADFTDRSTVALGLAGERVRAKYGFYCTSAAATTEQIHDSAQRFEADGLVQVVTMHPPLAAP